MSLISSIIAIIFAVTIHEFAHAWAADRLGDPTARIYGRLTLNPLKHFDLVGTLCLIIFGIGWGKPVPFNPDNLRYPKRDSALVALAGPVSNLLTALVFAIPLKYLADTSFVRLPLYDLIRDIFAVSILLFSLNVLPFPPFDGSKIIGLIIPHRWHNVYENYLRDGVKYVMLFILFDVLVLKEFLGYSVLTWIVIKITMWVSAIISLGT